MYRVIEKFKDLEDNNHIYKTNDIYPREGLKPSEKRIKELSSKKNKCKKILIEEIDDNKNANGNDADDNNGFEKNSEE